MCSIIASSFSWPNKILWLHSKSRDREVHPIQEGTAKLDGNGHLYRKGQGTRAISVFHHSALPHGTRQLLHTGFSSTFELPTADTVDVYSVLKLESKDIFLLCHPTWLSHCISLCQSCLGYYSNYHLTLPGRPTSKTQGSGLI